MLILGKCPSCGTEDVISVGTKDLKTAKCIQCGTVWRDCFNTLLLAEKKKGRELIPVSVFLAKYGAGLAEPKASSIPYLRHIIIILNAALIQKFSLEANRTSEGGVCGAWKNEAIDLRNSRDELALWSHHHPLRNPGAREILSWYAELLKVLFEEELVVDSRNHGRGAILKISGRGAGPKSDVELLLYLALKKHSGSEVFSRSVFHRIKQETVLGAATYLSGTRPLPGEKGYQVSFPGAPPNLP